MQITDSEHFCTDHVCGSRLACFRRSDSGARAKERGKKTPGKCLEQASSRSVRNVEIVKKISPSPYKSDIIQDPLRTFRKRQLAVVYLLPSSCWAFSQPVTVKLFRCCIQEKPHF